MESYSQFVRKYMFINFCVLNHKLRTVLTMFKMIIVQHCMYLCLGCRAIINVLFYIYFHSDFMFLFYFCYTLRRLLQDCHSLLKDCHALFKDCHTLFKDCHIIFKDCHILFKDCHIQFKCSHTLFEDCHTLFKDCHTLLKDCHTLFKD